MKGLFNIRVYAIIIQNNSLLLSDEYIKGKPITKFPGGGLKFGEGTIDCIKRELMEELNAEANGIKHFYTTDFFQVSAYNKNQQIISIYYLIEKIDICPIKISTRKFDFSKPPKEGEQNFRWVKLNDINEDEFTFPIDKKVIRLLKF